jgi:hypothetical protein
MCGCGLDHFRVWYEKVTAATPLRAASQGMNYGCSHTSLVKADPVGQCFSGSRAAEHGRCRSAYLANGRSLPERSVAEQNVDHREAD